MHLTYLIKNSDTKKRFEAAELPDGVVRGAVGSYEADGGKLYLLSFSIEGCTISGARTLSKLRDKLRDDASSRLIVDDASLKFATALYPRLAEYERKLRRAITLATCAEHDNFDDGLVLSLENLSLRELGNQLFYDRSLQDKIKNRVKAQFTKAELSEYIVQLTENTVWTNLFSNESLKAVRKNYWSLCETRNKVMHQRFLSEKQYDYARKMLRESIGELDAYVERILSDVNYPKRHADRAASAVKLIRENYESIFQNLGGSLERFAEIAGATQNMPSVIDTSGFASLATRMAEIQDAISANQALMESMQSISDKISAMQTPSYASTLASVAQQIQLPKLMNEGALTDLVEPIASTDWPTPQASILAGAGAPILPSLDDIGSFAAVVDDIDDDMLGGDSPDEDSESETSS